MRGGVRLPDDPEDAASWLPVVVILAVLIVLLTMWLLPPSGQKPPAPHSSKGRSR